jgi:tetratricopeptide (TPR) repeat protein
MDNTLFSLQSTKAKTDYEAGNFLQAASGFKEASLIAHENGEILAAAELENNCCVALLKAGKFQDAHQMVAGTDKVFANAGDTHRQGMALGNLAAALEGLKKWDAAAAAYEQSAAMFSQSLDREHRSYVLKCLSKLQARNGRYFEALATMQAALQSQNKISIPEQFLKKLLQTIFRMIK